MLLVLNIEIVKVTLNSFFFFAFVDICLLIPYGSQLPNEIKKNFSYVKFCVFQNNTKG